MLYLNFDLLYIIQKYTFPLYYCDMFTEYFLIYCPETNKYIELYKNKKDNIKI